MMLPSRNGTEFGKHPIITRTSKGIFRNCPPLPRYMVTYDPDLALDFLKSLPSQGNITLKCQTLQTATILALLSGHRCQSINSLTLAHMAINNNKVIFYIPYVVKHNTIRLFDPQPIELNAYNKGESICLAHTFVEYIKATQKNRKSENIIVSYHKHLKIRETNTQRSQDPHFIVYSPLYKTFQFIKDIHERDVLNRYCEKRRVEININIQRKFYNLPILDN